MSAEDAPLRSIGKVGLSLGVAGLLGIGCSVLTAARFGQGWETDALFMAQSLPLVFGKLFQSGPLPQVVMPIFLGLRAKGEAAQVQRYASNVLTVSCLVGGALALLLAVAAPWIVSLMAPGFAGEQRALTVGLSRLFVPVFFCTLVSSLLTGFLHASRRFGYAEWSARLPGVALLLVLLWGAGRWGIASLVWALVAGSIAQVLMLWVEMRRLGIAYRPLVDVRQPELRTTWARLTPFLATSVVVQAMLIVHRSVTSVQPEGTLSALSYADRVTAFAGSVLAVVPTVMFPQLIDAALAGDRDALRARLERVIALVSLVAFPCIMGLVVFSEPLIKLVLERGRFGAPATRETALALSWLAVGFFGWTVNGLGKSTAYALERPWVVNRSIAGAALFSIALTVTVGRWWGLAGLAIASGLVPCAVAAGYLWQLRREVPRIHRIVWNPTFLLIAAATAGMGAIGWALRQAVWAGWLSDAGWPAQALGLSAMALGSAAAYWLLLGLFRVGMRHEVAPMVLRAIGGARRTVPA